jgi:hypothetical protein
MISCRQATGLRRPDDLQTRHFATTGGQSPGRAQARSIRELPTTLPTGFAEPERSGEWDRKDLPIFATGFCNIAEASNRAAASRLERSILHMRFATRQTLCLRAPHRRCKTYLFRYVRLLTGIDPIVMVARPLSPFPAPLIAWYYTRSYTRENTSKSL